MIKVNLIVALLTLIASLVNAEIIFRQTASTSCSDFKNFNTGKGTKVGGETCTQANDGSIAIYKPSNSERAELRDLKAITIQKDKKYYISWNFKLSSTVTNNAIFQWKAYGDPMTQNFPVVIKFVGGSLNVVQFQDPAMATRSNLLFQKKLSPDQWYSHMIAISVSDQTEGGTVEYWFEGRKQELITHGSSDKTVWPCRTFDGSAVSPKWGIYGAVGTDVTSSFKDLTIGETLQDMHYGNGSTGYDSAGTRNRHNLDNSQVITTAFFLFFISILHYLL